MASLTLPVRSFDPITPRARVLVLDATAAEFTFRAGQAVWLGAAGQSTRKPYSIASAPHDLAREGRLEFLVGLEADGNPDVHLRGVGPGSRISLEGPLGGFELPRAESGAPVLLVGGGTGIAPLRSMWRELLAGESPPAIAVIYSARSLGDLAFVDELDSLAQAGQLSLAITVTGAVPEWRGLRGRISAAILRAHVPSATLVRCAVCGSQAFAAHVVEQLVSLGVAPSQVATEGW